MLNHRYLRFWCQKVLPLVYDDSLSYYELLCKVVAYLNNLTKDVVEVAESKENAINTFMKLLEYGIIPIVNENDTISTKEAEFTLIYA